MKNARRATTLISLALGSALLLGACGGAKVQVGTSPTDGFPTGGFPTGGLIHLSSGAAHVEISGGATLDLPLNTQSSTFYVGAAAASLNYTDPAGNTFGINGLFATGRTGPTFALTITTADPVGGYVSNTGECTVTFDSYDAQGAKGSFDCTDIKNLAGDGTANVSGTFIATA